MWDAPTVLPDGSHDALVVDASTDEDGAIVGLELVIVTGPYKGEMVALGASGLEGMVSDLLGIPATIVVTDGRPDLRLEP